jgi:hypothetical protein
LAWVQASVPLSEKASVEGSELLAGMWGPESELASGASDKAKVWMKERLTVDSRVGQRVATTVASRVELWAA